MSIYLPTAPSVIPTPDGDLLVDRFGRSFDYLRIAVNDRCNLRCVYCMPEEGINFLPSREVLATNEILRIVRVASKLGISKLRYTGGEPLLRRDIIQLVDETSRIPGIQSVHLTTNGVLLAQYAPALQKGGLYGVNISLDTLNETKYLKITRRRELPRVLEGLEKCMALKFPSVKINVVAMRGLNDDELVDFIELTRTYPITVRFIELMPFNNHQEMKPGRFYSADDLVSDLKQIYPQLASTVGSSTELYAFKLPGYQGKIAVIPAYNRDLCSGCTRVRVTADGRIRNCLYYQNGYHLGDLIKNGGTDRDIIDLFKQAMNYKMKDGWEAQQGSRRLRESMTRIGG